MTASLAPSEEAACLAVDPFAGAYDGGELLSDAIVTVRKAYVGGCTHCRDDIRKGSRVRSRAYRRSATEFNNFRWCTACCIALPATDGGYGWQARKDLSLGADT